MQRRCSTIGSTPTIAEGIAVSSPGELTTRIVRALVDDVLLVDEDAIEEVIAMLIDVEKTVAEGAGVSGVVRAWPQTWLIQASPS